MKYVITGGAGNISKPLTEKLLKAGHSVTVIGRNAEHLNPLTALGATAAIGSFEDVEFLKKTFIGADAVYTMTATHFGVTDLKGFIEKIGKNYAQAIKTANIKYVVNLSSVGADVPDGCGPVSGLYRLEQEFAKLKNVNILHLRPCYFYNNFFGSISMIKFMNMLGANFGGKNFTMALAHPDDIAEVAFEELHELKFRDHSVKYIASDERSTDDIAKVLGTAIDKPELSWVVFTDEEAKQGMVQAGFPEEFARNYTEMGHALQSGFMMADYWENHPLSLGKVKLEDFAKVFATVYNNN